MSRSPSYRIEIQHSGLNKYRLVTGPDRAVVERKAGMIRASWNEEWEKKVALRDAAQQREGKIAYAAQMTEEIKSTINELHAILRSRTIDFDEARFCDTLKHREEYEIVKPEMPTEPMLRNQPLISDPPYQVRDSILSRIMQDTKKHKDSEIQNRFNRDLSLWIIERDVVMANYYEELSYAGRLMREWNAQRLQFFEDQQKYNRSIDDFLDRYRQGISSDVVKFFERALGFSKYPDVAGGRAIVSCEFDTGRLAIDCSLPSPDVMPKIKEVRYNKSRDEIQNLEMRRSEIEKIYNNAIHQICLRILYEVFLFDHREVVKSVVFNGWVNSIDQSTGNRVDACIMTVSTSREVFSKLNLDNVDAKACFKSLRGIGSSNLAGITPVAPIVRLNREDKRFIDGIDIIDNLEDGTNLAMISWEDFEHLIREVFEKEFSTNGGEVKVTRASRDGGVDAIVFDPDPIRGGKIVIQAKRYTNTVGVSAVRDLYGTVVNEGASKGILVTTSKYGPDSYEFATNKPIVLLDGANLLSLLEKHGYRARISLSEAKKFS